eukprot:jgi/Tetstr1/428819/TSEL_018806.t1
MVTGAGFAITAVISEEHAMALLTDRAASGAGFPSIVLLNNHVAGGSDAASLTFVRDVRQKFPDTFLSIIVVVTADESEDVLCTALAAGCNDCYIKPLSRNRLLARLHVQLELRNFWRFVVASRKSEALLQTILPPTMIKRYLQSEERVVDELPCISVLFTGIVDFPRIQDQLGCLGTMSLLHSLFCAFDDLTDMLGSVYKIETVGDTYMIMAGHDDSSERDHAHRLAWLARAMLRKVAGPAFKLPTGEQLQLRVGIHTGSAHCGIIGLKCPRFCLFGDTVNTSSRMMSTGLPQCAQISEATFYQLKEEASQLPQFGAARLNWVFSDGETNCQALGSREIKGKGNMNTWLLPIGNAAQAAQEYIIEAPAAALEKL